VLSNFSGDSGERDSLPLIKGQGQRNLRFAASRIFCLLLLRLPQLLAFYAALRSAAVFVTALPALSLIVCIDFARPRTRGAMPHQFVVVSTSISYHVSPWRAARGKHEFVPCFAKRQQGDPPVVCRIGFFSKRRLPQRCSLNLSKPKVACVVQSDTEKTLPTSTLAKPPTASSTIRKESANKYNRFSTR